MMQLRIRDWQRDELLTNPGQGVVMVLDTHRLRINFFSFAGSILVSRREQLLH
jgi:hypothetical protein